MSMIHQQAFILNQVCFLKSHVVLDRIDFQVRLSTSSDLSDLGGCFWSLSSQNSLGIRGEGGHEKSIAVQNSEHSIRGYS